MRSITVNRILPVVVVAGVIGIVGTTTTMHRRHLRSMAESGLQQELRDNNDGLQSMREALPTEIKNISDIAELLQQKELGHRADGQSAQLGLQVMALTNANWQAASATDAIKSMDYGVVERFAAAYFEQARLAQLQTSTLEAMMILSSYIGHGERIALLTPEQASLAEVQAQLLMAHLRVMSRMIDGVQGAYKAALGGS